MLHLRRPLSVSVSVLVLCFSELTKWRLSRELCGAPQIFIVAVLEEDDSAELILSVGGASRSKKARCIEASQLRSRGTVGRHTSPVLPPRLSSSLITASLIPEA